MIKIKRAYEPAAATDGRRFLVDRVWPRGRRKEDLQIEAWVKEAGPSTELRKWFGHDPRRWAEFQQRYRRELDADKAALGARPKTMSSRSLAAALLGQICRRSSADCDLCRKTACRPNF
jgi:uncharacterized protein YeaO (DUF488 family)